MRTDCFIADFSFHSFGLRIGEHKKLTLCEVYFDFKTEKRAVAYFICVPADEINDLWNKFRLPAPDLICGLARFLLSNKNCGVCEHDL